MDKKISELTTSLVLTSSAVFPIVQDGVNKKISAANIFGKVNVPLVVNEHSADQDTVIKGQADQNLFFVDASANKVSVGNNAPQEKLDVTGGVRLNGRVRNESVDTITSSGTASLVTCTSVIAMSAAGTVTLEDGSVGQYKEFVSSDIGPVVLTATSAAGFASVTFDGAGQTCTMKFISGNWYIMSYRGVTIV